MTENQQKLMNKLTEMFQFDQADLDFGIYRIMNFKRAEIEDFLHAHLAAQITEQLASLLSLGNAKELAELEKEIANAKKMNVSEATKAAMLSELEEKKKSLGVATDSAAVEAEIYSHLANFFSRYYDEGDFISQRMYKDGVYAIPYEGEEVKLHWANADQYYIKTSENFKNYSFKTAYGKTVRFKLIEAETERDNNMANKKRIFQLYTDNPFALEDGDLIIHFVYKEGDKKQETYIAEAVTAFTRVAVKYMDYADIIKVVEGKTLLGKQLKSYTARNTFDYFIHKDLGSFLNRELDFYIKTEVMFLDDIDEQSDTKMKEYITKAKVIRNIAKKIITFLAQIEDFQKKLWLKKKFVVETNYCITLDRVPEELYSDILANRAQVDEWKSLYNIEAIEKDLVIVGYSEPLTIDFLKQNPYLVIDTAHFSSSFKDLLVDSIENLDESLDGLLIHSENFQALNLLQERYCGKAKCIYIDPPYNTDASAIIYKNGYKDSSWLSFVANRFPLANKILSDTGILCVTIDDFEFHRLKMLLENIYGQDRILGVVCIQNNPAGRSTAKGFSISHEYGIFVSKNENTTIGRLSHSDEQIARYKYVDEIGNFEWVNFRKHGGANANHHARPKLFYPIFISEDSVRFPQIEWNISSNSWSLVEDPRNNEKIIYPVTPNGEEKTWKWGHETARENLSEFSVRNDQLGELGVYMKARLNENGTLPLTIWNKKEYSSTEYGTNLLKRIFGESEKFSFPKSIYATKDCLKVCKFDKRSTVVDYFAGSGTTGHAVINLNREDGGSRKYILVEMGEYFDTVTKPRIMKVIYSKDWKDGKPVSREGSSHTFKYLRLESYEDTLSNINIQSSGLDMISNPGVKEQYLLQYMLPMETEGSPSLLNIDLLEHPFSYCLEITRNFESENKGIDLVETFNYLIGLKVEKSYQKQGYDADFTVSKYGRLDATLKTGDTYTIKMIEGSSLIGDKVLVIWRDLTGDKEKDNAVLDAYFLRKKINTRDFEFKKIYVNGDNNLLNLKGENESWKVLLIEEEMKKRMFEV